MAVGMIKLGVLPEEPKLYGICKKCGCEFSCEPNEVRIDGAGDSYPVWIYCPMGFCQKPVAVCSKDDYFAEKNKTPQPDAPRRFGINPLIVPMIVGFCFSAALLILLIIGFARGFRSI